MAKKATTPKKPTKKKKTDDAVKPQPARTEPKTIEVIEPQTVHTLFGLPGPYDPPRPPPPWPGAVTFWDCGISINELRRKRKDLFCCPGWLDSQRFAKDSDAWRWRQINLSPVGPGEPFAAQRAKLPKDDDPPLARDLVVYLLLHFLATGERLELPRLRCREVLPSGRRVVVGPFGDSGLEIANVSDRRCSPGIALCSSFTPEAKKK